MDKYIGSYRKNNVDDFYRKSNDHKSDLIVENHGKPMIICFWDVVLGKAMIQ